MKGPLLRTIAIINQKGGCGKTTTAVNLAAVLAALGRKTLLVDMDPQAHCALGLAVPEAQLQRSIGEVLRAGLDGSLAFSDIVWQVSRNLDLAPSTMGLAGIEQELAGAPDKDRRLAQILSTVADLYEFCIIDCPPSIGLLTFNALRASDEVIIPVETGYFAMQGAFKQEATIDMLARRANHRARFRVLATMYDVRTKLAREILAELRKHFGEKLLPVVVHFNSKLKEAASFGQAITEYDPGSTGYQDFEQLAQWLLANPPQGSGMPAPAGQGTTTGSPALSRAAELVERARALSARTAALSAKLAAEADAASGPIPPEPSPTETASSGNVLTLSPLATAVPASDLAAKLARVYGVRPTSQGLLFVQPASGALNVSVAGDFNHWSPTSHPLRCDPMLGVMQAIIPVPPGRYRYRLVVNGEWIQDPYNKYVESNPFGELNNIVEVES